MEPDTIAWTNLASAFIGAVGGGVVTGSFALLAAHASHINDIRRDEKRRDESVKGVLQALHNEIETLWHRYAESVGNHIAALPEGEPFAIYYGADQNYFTIYNSNANLIGQINDGDLRKSIVTTYTQAKALLDSYQMNNHLLGEWETLHWAIQEKPENGNMSMRAASAHKVLVEYAQSLKASHEELEVSVQDLLHRLHKTGVLDEK